MSEPSSRRHERHEASPAQPSPSAAGHGAPTADDETSAHPRYLSMTTPTDLEELAKDIRDELVTGPGEEMAGRGGTPPAAQA